MESSEYMVITWENLQCIMAGKLFVVLLLSVQWWKGNHYELQRSHLTYKQNISTGQNVYKHVNKSLKI